MDSYLDGQYKELDWELERFGKLNIGSPQNELSARRVQNIITSIEKNEYMLKHGEALKDEMIFFTEDNYVGYSYLGKELKLTRDLRKKERMIAYR